MSLRNIAFIDYQGVKQRGQISEFPDTCPVCGNKITPEVCFAYTGGFIRHRLLEVVFKCPNDNCKHLFLAYYSESRSGHDYFILSSTKLPFVFEIKEFPKIIGEISEVFPVIYNQALLAEENGLDQICGGGYRKALEFLLKDYLIYLNPADEEEIKKMWLKDAISKIKTQNIKICAKRAAWLGNDELHYTRKWVDKDIDNLKDLIELVVHWIEDAEKTKEYENDMSDG